MFDMLGIPSLSELARWELKAHFEIQGSACVGLEASGGLFMPRFLKRRQSCRESSATIGTGAKKFAYMASVSLSCRPQPGTDESCQGESGLARHHGPRRGLFVSCLLRIIALALRGEEARWQDGNNSSVRFVDGYQKPATTMHNSSVQAVTAEELCTWDETSQQQMNQSRAEHD